MNWAAVLDRLLLMGTDGWAETFGEVARRRYSGDSDSAGAARGMRYPEAVLSLRSPGTPSRRARLPMIPLDVLTHFT